MQSRKLQSQKEASLTQAKQDTQKLGIIFEAGVGNLTRRMAQWKTDAS